MSDDDLSEARRWFADELRFVARIEDQNVVDAFAAGPRERVVHLGCGMGYYSAVLAELVGPTGEISAIEIDEPLAERARAALAPWSQVTVINGDGATVGCARAMSSSPAPGRPTHCRPGS